MSKKYRMPYGYNNQWTTDPDEHCNAWEDYVAPITTCTGWVMISFNPGATFQLRNSEEVVHLKPEALHQLRDTFLRMAK